MRVRVYIDISQSLCRVRLVNLQDSQAQWISFKYERMPIFCYWCGVMNHDEKDCRLRVSSQGTLKEDQQYGAQLRATTEWFQLSHVVQNKPTQYPPAMAAPQQKQRSMARFLEVITGESMERGESSGHGEVQPTQVHGNSECQLSNSTNEILANPEMFGAHLESIDWEIGKFS